MITAPQLIGVFATSSSSKRSSMTIPVAPASPISVNNRILVAVKGTGGMGAASVTDPRSNTYNVDTPAGGAGTTIQVFDALVETAPQTGDSITVTFPSSITGPGAVAIEVPGITPSSSSPLIVSSGASNGENGRTNTQSVTAPYGDCVLVSAYGAADSVFGAAASAGWQVFQNALTTVYGCGIAVYQNPIAGSTQEITWSATTPLNSAAVIAAYASPSDPIAAPSRTMLLAIGGALVQKSVLASSGGMLA